MDNIQDIPKLGWIAIIITALLGSLILMFAILIIYKILMKKTFKTRFFDLSDDIPDQYKERYKSEGKDQLDNQSSNAKHLLGSIRERIYGIGVEVFNLDEKNQIILSLIAERLVDKILYETTKDLTRNHIVTKTDSELRAYSFAKAEGYYHLISNYLADFNLRIPEHNLCEIMDRYTLRECQDLFNTIYFSAKAIAGGSSYREEDMG